MPADVAGTSGSPSKLTVVIAVPRDEDATAALALLASESTETCTVIVAHAGEVHYPERGHTVSYLQCSGRNIFELWAAGLRAATGEYVAVLDARCPPSSTWLPGVRRAIADGATAFFGPVTYDLRNDGAFSVQYLLEYAQFSRPIDKMLDEVPGNNFIFRRALLGSEALADAEFHKVFFVQKLRAGGCFPSYRDDVEVLYRKRYSWRHFMLRRFAHARTFAARRNAGMAKGTRYLFAAGTPSLPLLRISRSILVLARKPRLLKVYSRSAVRVLCAEIAWSLGEAVGYLSDRPGNVRFMD